jgi:hypothetical protein
MADTRTLSRASWWDNRCLIDWLRCRLARREDVMDKPDSSLQEDSSSSIFKRPIGRRDLLKGAGALGVAGLAAPLFSAADAIASAGSKPRSMPIKHIVVDMQENRSFDHYYGFASFAGKYGVPSTYFQPDGQGGKVVSYHFASLSTPDIGQSHVRRVDASWRELRGGCQRRNRRSSRATARRKERHRKLDGVLHVLSGRARSHKCGAAA